MLDALLNDARFRRIFPPVAALGMIGLFVSLGSWQLDRAAEKNSLRSLFASDAPYLQLSDVQPEKEFQNIEVTGLYVGERQVLLENMFDGGRRGYYVLTPFRPAAGLPWLIVNRGWIATSSAGEPDPDVSIVDTDRTLRGRIGYLPRVGIRQGAAFANGEGWPKKAVYPTLEDLSAKLGQELLPFVLLLGAADEDGFVRRWQPRGSGPMTHYGYAFQWFAMAAAVFGLLLWHLRERRN